MIPACDDGIAAVPVKDFERAEKLLAACTESNAAPLEVFLMLAAMHQSRRDESALLATSREGIKRSPEERRFYLSAGTILGRRGQFDEAIDALETALQRWPEDAKLKSLLESALLGRGTQFLDEGDNTKAVDALQRAVSLVPTDVEAWMNLGRAQQNQLRYADALHTFNRVAELQPATPLVHFHRGLSQFSLGAFPAAITDMDTQIRVDASYWPARLIRGLSSLALGDTDGALPDLELAASKMPDSARAHDGLGRALLRLNRLAAAEVHLRKATTLDPSEPAYVVNGSALGGILSTRSALYRNNHDGTFTDVTGIAGVEGRVWGKGAIAVDLNGASWPDLYVVSLGMNVLYLNNGNGTFRNATGKSGLGDARWSAAAAVVDYDADGDLDLFVANYLEYDLENLPTEGKFCSYQHLPVACGPQGLKGARDALYRNNGDGTFTDVAVELGIDPELHYGLAVAWGDYDNDGDPDLFVANDNTPNDLYRNDSDGTFTEVAIEANVAFSEDGREQSCMGVAFDDLDNDGWLDIMVTNFSDDYTTLYRNTGKGDFIDDSARAGLVADSWRDLSWGVGFVDFNNDGWKDVFVANGHIYPQVDRASLNTSYCQRNKPLPEHRRTALAASHR